MSPVIRLSDSTYNRLESHAIGFDAPNNVIERLIDFYESHHKNSQQSNSKLHETTQTSQSARRASPSIRKPRDTTKENQLKKCVGKQLKREQNWGEFEFSSKSVLKFQNSPSKVLCKYSSYSTDPEKWFWGVGKKYWSKWDDNFYLALLMENEDQISYSFLLLKPKEAMRLFKDCSESGGEKKINLRKYNDGLLHLQEWQDYDVKKNIRKIEI